MAKARRKTEELMEPLRITKEEVKRRLDAGEHIVFLDTRSEEAWSKAELQIPQSRQNLRQAEGDQDLPA
jgi:hypothetical protein